MNFAVVGVNHNDTPIHIRENVSFTDTQKIEGINFLLDNGISEVVVLSTCNRSEIYIYSDDILKKIEIVKDFYEDFFNVDNIKEYLFCKTGQYAIEHVFRVSAGLDSIVLGEDQILGQVKDAHEFSKQLGASKKVFNKLFREAITASKDIKTTTKISHQPISISYIGIKCLKDRLGSLEGKNALVIGIGKMSKLAMKHLEEEKLNSIYVTNRSYEKLQDIQDEYKNLIPIKYEERYSVLEKVDVVISATASPHTVIKKENMPNLSNTLIMMDIALPRDIDKNIDTLENIEVYDIDDLKKISDENDKKRRELACTGELLIDEKIDEFNDWLETIKIDPTIQSLNDKCTDIREDTLDYIYRKLDLNCKEKKIIDKMLTSALKRLIREPILNLKQIKDSGKQEEYIKIVEELFDL
ncbi:glutamyl-tRNA reductase [[Clostridium] sordellii]|uniref:glutamyl-tRNA reductase n=1 Tax=Paraclostridium sordellii TaxID=1505 RepID=UPI0005424672|nr:glutamyl-tRNA reductase [Paeniclostridium sordellii]CEK34396.1 glutamyl-tRNA reductase,Glutamyl-tRNA reductase,glutamyl-tRNA reductase,Glutamyl-tRNA reductase,glutamyl-tRNA reductase,Glutamyl-tRNAGlu reductase, N-terminal domain [[Clostridium] sordellii] [Paeniclostridium sordellii]CEN82668.1 glutamyl-tRNA reductase [[Clostridium] sordellii] [Paeniclostridium sordellii]CEQ19602.1 glutamyl-tRNA reductase [[Clostridium] sordellii] [Paeniclostridium sordellii]CEQ23029.1 glutamyl-tRNA reductase 